MVQFCSATPERSPPPRRSIITPPFTDLVAATAGIQRAAVRIKGEGIVMLPPKTERGRRAIALDPETVDVLRAHRGAQLIQRTELRNLYENSGHVFTGPTGAPLDPSTY